MRNLIFVVIFSLAACFGCQHDKKQKPLLQKKTGELIIADTIIYDVIVRNVNPENKWATETLKNLNLDTLINTLFQAVYERDALAIDYFTDKRIRPNKLRKMEQDGVINREEIGKIQFTEIWFYQQETMNFRKEVISVVLGQELYDLDGNVRGYKPVFKFDFNPLAN